MMYFYLNPNDALEIGMMLLFSRLKSYRQVPIPTQCGLKIVKQQLVYRIYRLPIPLTYIRYV